MARIVIDLNGPEGNAFVLLAIAKGIIHTYDMETSILDDMMAHDYDHLVEVFRQHFGQVIELRKG